MKSRWVLSGLAVLGIGWGQSQSYYGLGVSLASSSEYGLTPLLSVQVGGPAAPEFGSLELRATFDTVLLFSNVGFDVFASVRLPDAALRLISAVARTCSSLMAVDPLPGREGPQVFFGAHGTVGLEALTGSVRPYAELQPAAALIYDEPVFGLRARAGLNVYF